MIWIAAVCAVVLFICMPLYIHYKKSLRYHLACSYKSTGTLCAFMLALIAAIKLDPRCYICAGALLLYAAADYLLEFNFMLGAGFFLAGHICNIAFSLNLTGISVLHLFCLLLMGALLVLVFYRWRKQIGKQMPMFIVYGISLLFMCICAIGCFSLNNLAGILIACGGALFYLSDFLILRRILFPTDEIYNWLIMISYYGAVLLFGSACLQL